MCKILTAHRRSHKIKIHNRFGRALYVQLIDYPTPINLSYFYSFGSISGLTMALQAVTGIILASMYVPHEDYVTARLQSIQRDCAYGWLVRSSHANGPSMLFAGIYLHMARSILVGSRSGYAWISGWFVLVLSIVTSFLGYSLVWSQMSYWAATVITNIITLNKVDRWPLPD